VYWVVGEGPDRPAIENTIIQQGLQDRVILFGDVDDAGLMTAYRLADLFIMPNIYVPGDVEGFGIVALEAALNKVCVVASRLEGIVDAITDQKNGILVPPGDTVAYVQTIETLLNQTEQRRQCAQNAQQFTIARFSWSKIVGQYLEVYSSVSNDSALPIKKA
jgi:phosphatidylinositol alpha-1,6-mannosyltransferase